ncbi:MAG: uncharacterized protein JWP25_4297 [Bradyrhizobium sp.]|nr:uncharacterized protein [Bradyrhizobium sp.]
MAAPTPPTPIVTPAGLALMEREFKATQENFKGVEISYGNDLVGLAIATRYVATLLRRPKIVHFLEENHPEILTELRTILSATPMEDPQEKRTEANRQPPHVNADRPKGTPAFVPSRGRKWQRSTSRIIDPEAPR